jgi:cysteine desulfuration protein SufE
MTTEEVQNQIVEEFSLFDEWMDKYELIIEMGNELTLYDEKYKTPSNIINGCQSRVWLNADFTDGKVVFTADADAIIAKGIIALLMKVLSNRTPEEIIATELFFIDSIGLRQNLSPTRANGLVSMIKQMKNYAIAYQAKMKIK